MELLKENKKIFAVSGIVFIVLFLTILIISWFGGTSNKLLLKCESHIYQGVETIQRMEFYSESDYRKLIQYTKFLFPEDKGEEYAEQLSSILISNIKKNVESSFGGTDDVSFSSKSTVDGVEIIIEYKITKNNFDDMYQILNLNLYNISSEELETYFTERGFICEK